MKEEQNFDNSQNPQLNIPAVICRDIYKHLSVIENYLKRLLKKNEIVHHKDGNKHNNSIENLEVMSISNHSRLHTKTGRTYVEFVCPNCSKTFLKEKRQLRVENPKCSRRCNGQYSRKKQLGLI
jgi:predicted RNA-binding Zn-ribbon protein involved in translation (DUF1610 family)